MRAGIVEEPVAHESRRANELGARFETLDDLPVSVAVLNDAGCIVRTNRRWRKFGRDSGLRSTNHGIGLNYVAICEQSLGSSSKLVRDLKSLLSGETLAMAFDYPCDTPYGRRWFILLGVALSYEGQAGAVLLHIDITSLLPHSALPDGHRVWEHDLDTLLLEHNGYGQVDDIIDAAVERAVGKAMSTFLAQSSATDSAEKEAESCAAALNRVRAVLSRRQFEVFTLIGEGHTNRQIAEALSMSPNTARLHVSAILKRLALSSRTQAALLASKLQTKLSIEAAARG